MGWSREEVYRLPVKERAYWSKWCQALRIQRGQEQQKAVREAEAKQRAMQAESSRIAAIQRMTRR